MFRPNALFNSKDYINTTNLGDIIDCYMSETQSLPNGYRDYYQFMDNIIAEHLNNDIPFYAIVAQDGNVYYTSLLRLSHYDWNNMYVDAVNLAKPTVEESNYLSDSSRGLGKQYVPFSPEYRNLIETSIDALSVITGQKIDYSRFVEQLYITYKYYNPEFAQYMRDYECRYNMSDLSW